MRCASIGVERGSTLRKQKPQLGLVLDLRVNGANIRVERISTLREHKPQSQLGVARDLGVHCTKIGVERVRCASIGAERVSKLRSPKPQIGIVGAFHCERPVVCSKADAVKDLN